MTIDHNARHRAAFRADFERALADQPEWIRARAVLGGPRGSLYYPDGGYWKFKDADGNVLEEAPEAKASPSRPASERAMAKFAESVGQFVAEKLAARDARIVELETRLEAQGRKIALLSQRMKEGEE